MKSDLIMTPLMACRVNIESEKNNKIFHLHATDFEENEWDHRILAGVTEGPADWFMTG